MTHYLVVWVNGAHPDGRGQGSHRRLQTVQVEHERAEVT